MIWVRNFLEGKNLPVGNSAQTKKPAFSDRLFRVEETKTTQRL